MDSLIKDLSLESAQFIDRPINVIMVQTEEFLENAYESLCNGGLDHDLDILLKIAAKHSYFSRKLELNDEHHQRIYYYGIWKATLELLKKSGRINQEKRLFSSLLMNYKHIGKIVEMLGPQNVLSHQEIAERINMSPSALSNMINRIEKYNLFVIKKIGKQKRYRLSSDGIELFRYYKQHTVHQDANSSLFQYVSKVLQIVAREYEKRTPTSIEAVNEIDKEIGGLSISQKRHLLVSLDRILSEKTQTYAVIDILEDIRKENRNINQIEERTELYINNSFETIIPIMNTEEDSEYDMDKRHRIRRSRMELVR